MEHKCWSIKEDDFLKRNYSNLNNTEIGNLLNKSNNSITNRLKILNLRRTKESRKEIVRKIGKANKGMKMSYEHKLKIKKALQEFHRRNLNLYKGINNPNYGNHLSEKSKKKISEANKGRVTLGFRDHKHREESRLKISNTLKEGYGSGRLSYVKKILSNNTRQLWKNEKYRNEVIRNSLRALLKRPTSYEQKILNLCLKYKLPFSYIGDGKRLIGYKNPDFIDETRKIVIEVFLDYFKIRDFGSIEKYMEVRRGYFTKYGYRTIFISEKEINHNNWEKVCLNKINEVL